MVAARAVPVSAGVISFFHVAASVTDLPMGAEITASAMLNIVHDLVLSGMQPVCVSKGRAEFPEDIADRGAIIRFVGKRLM